MAVILNPNQVTPIGGQGLGGKTTHSNATRLNIPAGAIASGDTMVVAHLPHSSRPLRLTVKNNTGVALTYSLGTAINATEFRASAAHANGAVVTDIQPGAVMTRYALYPTTPIVATFGAAATIPAGANLDISFEYLVDEPVLPIV